ncbi:MAG: tetratricopeptide repeat protein [Polyangiaceae bacterium]
MTDPRAEHAGQAADQPDVSGALRALQDGDLALASVCVERLYTSNQDPEGTSKALGELARRAADLDHPSLAARWLELAIGLRADDPSLWMQLISFYRRAKNPSLLRRVSEQFLERFPGNVLAHTNYGEVLREAGSFNEAARILGRAVARFPGHSLVHHAFVSTLRATGRLEEASAACDQALTRFPDDEVMWTARARLWKALGELERALATFEQCIARWPDKPWLRTWRAEMLMLLGRLPEALQAYEETVRLAPHNLLARTGIARVLAVQGDVDRALATADATCRRFRGATATRAWVLSVARRHAEARDVLSELRRVAPADEHLRTSLGLVHQRLGELERAEALLKDKRSPCSGRSWFRFLALGLVRLEAGAVDRAAVVFDTGTASCPWPRQRYRFGLARSLAHLVSGHPDAAIALLDGLPGSDEAVLVASRHALQRHAAIVAGRTTEDAPSAKSAGVRYPVHVDLESELTAAASSTASRAVSAAAIAAHAELLTL